MMTGYIEIGEKWSEAKNQREKEAEITNYFLLQCLPPLIFFPLMIIIQYVLFKYDTL